MIVTLRPAARDRVVFRLLIFEGAHIDRRVVDAAISFDIVRIIGAVDRVLREIGIIPRVRRQGVVRQVIIAVIGVDEEVVDRFGEVVRRGADEGTVPRSLRAQ